MTRRWTSGAVAVFVLAVVVLSIGHATAADWSARIEVAEGNAEHGPWRMNESDWDYLSDPTVAIADDGHAGVAWSDQASQNIFFQMYTPDGAARFAEPVNASNHPGIFSWLPRMVIPGDDPQRVYLLWQEIIFTGAAHGGDIFFARSRDGGETFSEPLNLSNSEAGAGKGRLTEERWDNGSLDLVQGPEGTLYAAWSEYEGRLFVSRSTDGGETFSEPLHLAGDDTEPTRGPTLAVDGAGAVHLAWTFAANPAADVQIVSSTDGGRSFGEVRVAAAGDGHADAPKLVADSRDRLHLVYAESPDGTMQRYHLRYARKDTGSDDFSESRRIVAPGEGLESVRYPHLAVDGADRLYLAWERFPEHDRFPRGLGFSRSDDGGETFAAPDVVPGSNDPALGFNGNLQGDLMRKLAVNAEGTVALVNSTYAHRDSSRIWLWQKPGAGE